MRKFESLELYHFPLWILKDAAWFFGLGELSLCLAIPAVILSIFLGFIKRGLEKWEWSLISLWLISNVLWMSSELITREFHSYAEKSWQVSLLILPLYFVAIKRYLKHGKEEKI